MVPNWAWAPLGVRWGCKLRRPLTRVGSYRLGPSQKWRGGMGLVPFRGGGGGIILAPLRSGGDA